MINNNRQRGYMARQPRFELPGQTQHIIQRGNNRQEIFTSDRDYRFYLDKLNEKSIEHRLYIHAYVLMPNHTHILATPQNEKSISKVLQSLGRCYAQYYNYIHDRTGTIFEGRYRATLVDADTYLLPCYQYIELNPVRAGLCRNPADYFWSSHRHNALGINDHIITPHRKYLSLASESSTCHSAYKSLFKIDLNAITVEEITEATNKSWVLGSKNFKHSIEQILNRRSSPKPRGGDRKSINWNIKQA